jgi:polyhydroxybutyrate depolymerase
MHYMFRFLLPISFFCILNTALTAQVFTDSMLIEKNYRSFHYSKPDIQKKASLIFILHGSGGNGLEMMTVTDSLEKFSRTENFLLVYPNGYKKFWNECRKASTALANIEDINEELFFEEMIRWFQKKYAIDTTNVFVIGFSGGGHMAYKLGVSIPEKLSGITAIAANLPAPDNMDCTEKKRPIAVMIVNGTADGVSPYEGGLMKTQHVVLGNVRSAEASFNYWANLCNYGKVYLVQPIPDKDITDSIRIEKYAFLSDYKPDIVLFKVYNGKHEFPKGIDAFVEAWWFFKKAIKKERNRKNKNQKTKSKSQKVKYK